MKQRALVAGWILCLGALAVAVAAAQPRQVRRPAERADPADLADRATTDLGNCQRDTYDALRTRAIDAQGKPLAGVGPAVEVDCSLTLNPTDVVTRTILVAGVTHTGAPNTGITINCNGAKIVGTHWDQHEAITVASRTDANGIWSAPENITVRNCIVEGRVRVAGGIDHLRERSTEFDYTRKLQEISPKNIVFDNLTITASGKEPFYVFPGAQRVTLMNSTINGNSDGVAIYLDAESAENVIKDNNIGVDSDDRQQIAIDGSARNVIVGNTFSGLDTGGIFIFRNCGEDTAKMDPRKGVVRQQWPEDNVILDNIFVYKNYNGPRPAVWIAARQMRVQDGDIGYCGDDSWAPRIGSNLDHFDHAGRTVVAHNRFIGRDPIVTVDDFPGPGAPQGLIKLAPGPTGAEPDPAYVFDNVRVGEASDRNSSCYVANAYPSPFVAHGQAVTLFDDGAGPRCTGRRLICNDGTLTAGRAKCAVAAFAPRPSVAAFECRADGDNNGCTGRARCPMGTATAIKAACNLETGSVSDAQLAKTPWSFAAVVRRSDNRVDGVCTVGNVDVGETGALLRAPAGETTFACREDDHNGGDCHIRVALACNTRATFENRTGIVQ